MQLENKESKRPLPNILVTGTPGTGKSTTCESIVEATGLHYVNVGELVRSQDLHCGWDDEFSCHIIDEDKVSFLDTLIFHWNKSLVRLQCYDCLVQPDST